MLHFGKSRSYGDLKEQGATALQMLQVRLHPENTYPMGILEGEVQQSIECCTSGWKEKQREKRIFLRHEGCLNDKWRLIKVLVSVVLPCLNESRTLASCIESAQRAIKRMGVKGEVIVADNGSHDGSPQIASMMGAKVVVQSKRGYGNACRAGMDAAKGKFILLADSDGTYDLGEIWKLVEMLQRGYDLVLGSRLRGQIEKGAMPFLHRYVGTPVLNVLMRLLFGVRVSDSQSGMRGVRREAYRRLDLKGEGMEFASEMLIKAAMMGMRIGEVPISYRRREGGESKLRTFRDGWRHLRFMLSCWAFNARGPKLF